MRQRRRKLSHRPGDPSRLRDGDTRPHPAPCREWNLAQNVEVTRQASAGDSHFSFIQPSPFLLPWPPWLQLRARKRRTHKQQQRQPSCHPDPPSPSCDSLPASRSSNSSSQLQSRPGLLWSHSPWSMVHLLFFPLGRGHFLALDTVRISLVPFLPGPCLASVTLGHSRAGAVEEARLSLPWTSRGSPLRSGEPQPAHGGRSGRLDSEHL